LTGGCLSVDAGKPRLVHSGCRAAGVRPRRPCARLALHQTDGRPNLQRRVPTPVM